MIARIRMYSKKEIAAALILLCANVLMGLTIWLGYKYDQIHFDQILFNMKSTTTGAQSTLVGSGAVMIGVLPVALTILEIWLYPTLASLLRNRILTLATVLLAITLFLFSLRIDIYAYVKSDVEKSDFIGTF